MKIIARIIIFVLLIGTTAANCTYFGSLSRIPIAGDLLITHTAGKIDFLTRLYIAGGQMLPETNLVRTLGKKTAEKAVSDLGKPGGFSQSRNSLSYGQGYDLFSLANRILYWLPPFFLGIFAVTFFQFPGKRSRKKRKK